VLSNGAQEGSLISGLKNFGFLKLFFTNLKDQVCHYIRSLPDKEKTMAFENKALPKKRGGVGRLSCIMCDKEAGM